MTYYLNINQTRVVSTTRLEVLVNNIVAFAKTGDSVNVATETGSIVTQEAWSYNQGDAVVDNLNPNVLPNEVHEFWTREMNPHSDMPSRVTLGGKTISQEVYQHYLSYLSSGTIEPQRDAAHFITGYFSVRFVIRKVVEIVRASDESTATAKAMIKDMLHE